MDALPVLNSMWVEGRLSYLEKVCLASAVAVGHKVVLYTYKSVEGVPAGVEVRDAREIMPEELLIKHKKSNSWSLGSNIFRYRLMQEERGIWIDTDVYFIKPLTVKYGEYLFGWQKEALINGAVLYMAKDSELVRELLEFVELPDIVPPWLPFRKKIRYQIRPWLGLRKLSLADHRWGVIGPRAITYFANKLNLNEHAVPQDVFYALPPKKAKTAFDPQYDVMEYVSDRTIAVHLWNEGIKHLKKEPAPQGSFVERICTMHGISMR